MEKTSNRFTVRRLAVTGLLSALVFVFSWIQIPIGEVARIHLGNVFCALSGLLFGPLTGGLASGFGSMLFDFTNPLYIAESWITFITKFFIGFLAGLIIEATVYQSLFCHGFLNCCQIRTIPVSSSAVCRHIRIVFVYSHLYQISFLCFWKFPLFPYTHAYSVVEPSVDLFDVVLHACYSVIVQPSSCIYLDFLKAWLD